MNKGIVKIVIIERIENSDAILSKKFAAMSICGTGE